MSEFSKTRNDPGSTLKVSIICASLGSANEIVALVNSIIKAFKSASKVLNLEFILVDQSEEKNYYSFEVVEGFNFVHIKNIKRGLSLNRNIGLEKASGDWIMIIDSDCLMTEHFFVKFIELKSSHPEVNHFLGRINVAYSERSLFRNWPSTSRSIHGLMFWYYATSVNSIFRKSSSEVRFDERFGLGAKYGSSEDIDFYLRLRSKCLYAPDLITFHPDVTSDKLLPNKNDSYSYGFGALCAKYIYNFGVFILLASLVKKSLDVLRGRATLEDLIRAIFFRFRGFWVYLAGKILSKHV